MNNLWHKLWRYSLRYLVLWVVYWALEIVCLVSQQIILRTIGIPIGQWESQLSIKCENISPFNRLQDLSNNGNSSVAIVPLCLVCCEGEL